MAPYSLQEESKRILRDVLLKDERLSFPDAFIKAADKIKFVGSESQPFIPMPFKTTESSSALNGLIAAAASAIAADRYGIDPQDIEVNTDIASLFLLSIILPTIDGNFALRDGNMQKELAKGDLYGYAKPIHQQCTNVYQAKDGKWFHLHGSMNATPCMQMLGVPEQDVTHDEARKIYAEHVSRWDAETLDEMANDRFKQAGTVVLTAEEFFNSEQGRAVGNEPLYTVRSRSAPRIPWPAVKDQDFRPLAGIRVIDLSRVIAAPVASKMLALLGADVIKVTYSGLPDIPSTWIDLSTGKRDVNINLKSEDGKKVFEDLIRGADVLIQGYRPGVFERLGFDTDSIRKINPSLIYVRENCYGWEGPLSDRSGWQQISDCITGVAWAEGRFLGLDEPVVPPLPNSDYQTGFVGAVAVLQALYSRSKANETFDIDISLTQYNIWFSRLGQYDAEIRKAIMERNPGLSLRHYDEMLSAFPKMLNQLKKTRAGLLQDPNHFHTMSGKEWGLNKDIQILASPFKLEKSKLDYLVPSGSRGRSKPEWIPRT